MKRETYHICQAQWLVLLLVHTTQEIKVFIQYKYILCTYNTRKHALRSLRTYCNSPHRYHQCNQESCHKLIVARCTVQCHTGTQTPHTFQVALLFPCKGHPIRHPHSGNLADCHRVGIWRYRLRNCCTGIHEVRILIKYSSVHHSNRYSRLFHYTTPAQKYSVHSSTGIHPYYIPHHLQYKQQVK